MFPPISARHDNVLTTDWLQPGASGLPLYKLNFNVQIFYFQRSHKFTVHRKNGGWWDTSSNFWNLLLEWAEFMKLYIQEEIQSCKKSKISWEKQSDGLISWFVWQSVRSDGSFSLRRRRDWNTLWTFEACNGALGGPNNRFYSLSCSSFMQVSHTISFDLGKD
jgi:hypothetical protein